MKKLNFSGDKNIKQLKKTINFALMSDKDFFDQITCGSTSEDVEIFINEFPEYRKFYLSEVK